MALIVQKFGGTSVGTTERIKNVAARVARTRAAGNDVVVVVSAMAGETNRLVKLAYEIDAQPIGREYDVLLASGEQVAIALLALALDRAGVPARSFLGHQISMITDTTHSRARIESVGSDVLRATLAAGHVAVVAGFQGIDKAGNITTLGRGGSDTTAVALAAALKADVCEIYTDVDGIYTADPNLVRGARKIPRISYEEMLELASLGAKVLQTRSVEFGMKYEVPIHVRSSFDESEGSWVVPEEETMEQVVVRAVTYDRSEARISVLGVPDRPGVAATVFDALADAEIVVDMIIQNASHEHGHTDLTFTVPKESAVEAVSLMEAGSARLGASEVRADTNIAKVSVVGVGMRSHSGVAAKMFRVLSGAGMNIQMITTSEIKISVVIEEAYTELAVRLLHQAFGLDVAPESAA
ncbi:MAG: aspartate kinase [Deltaproteobacteria bacterium HGW-Deltaproteobacteria-14]|jgi:aspartate kinase|nr:MAG: aspartate kinase [Deltaproteobacteria bacterium HGW-Deltaproteobacteria-14]